MLLACAFRRDLMSYEPECSFVHRSMLPIMNRTLFSMTTSACARLKGPYDDLGIESSCLSSALSG